MKKKEDEVMLPLTTTTVGSIVTSIGIIGEMTECQMLFKFRNLRLRAESLPRDLRDLVDVIARETLSERQYEMAKKYLVFVYDKTGIRSPLVTLAIEGNLMPLRKDGIYTGVLGLLMEHRENIAYEFVYETEETPGSSE